MTGKGARVERNLVVYLTQRGYFCHRIAGSGVGDTAVCDIIAIKEGVPYLIEVKSRKKVYYPRENFKQLEDLMKVANDAGAVALLAVKLNYKPWEFFNLREGTPKKVC